MKTVILSDNCRIDFVNHTIVKDENELRLQKREEVILKYLIENKDLTLSRKMIADANFEEVSTEDSVKTAIHNLRKKLPENCIETIPSFGYKFNSESIEEITDDLPEANTAESEEKEDLKTEEENKKTNPKNKKLFLIIGIVCFVIIAVLFYVFIIYKPIYHSGEKDKAPSTVKVAEFIKDVVWEEPDKVNVTGANQVPESDIKSGVVVKYSCNYSDLKLLKTQLDTLSCKYALGTKNEGEEAIVFVKTETKGISRSLMSLIGEKNHPYITCGEYFIELYSNYGSCSVDDKNRLIIKTDNGKINKLLDTVKASEKDEIYLMSKDYVPIMKASKKKALKDGYITFDCICNIEGTISFEDAKNSELPKKLCKLFNCRYCCSKVQDYYFDKANKNDFIVKESFEDKKLEKTINDICQNSEVAYNYSELNVSLNLSPDLSIGEKASEYVEKIYKAVDFENSAYTKINIYFLNSDKTDAMVVFEKKYNYYDAEYSVPPKAVKYELKNSSSALSGYQNEIFYAFNNDFYSSFSSFQSKNDSISYDKIEAAEPAQPPQISIN